MAARDEALGELARQQAALAACLAGAAPPPPGFDAGRVGTAAAMLRSKRRWSAARAWPALARALGDDFEPLFGEYARHHAMAEGTTPRDDAAAFARWLATRDALPVAGLVLLCAHEARRGWPIRVGFAGRPAPARGGRDGLSRPARLRGDERAGPRRSSALQRGATVVVAVRLPFRGVVTRCWAAPQRARPTPGPAVVSNAAGPL
jgi:hypothetical protein